MSMSAQTRKIECLVRLNALTSSTKEMLDFLVLEKLILKDVANAIARAPMAEKELYLYLDKISKEEKIQLLEYSWQILPKEVININIVTDSVNKNFSYAGY